MAKKTRTMVGFDGKPIMDEEEAQTTATQTNAGPVMKYRIGLVTANIWHNDGFYNVSIQRAWKDENGNWQNTNSIPHDQLLNAAKVLERAEMWIAQKTH